MGWGYSSVVKYTLIDPVNMGWGHSYYTTEKIQHRQRRWLWGLISSSSKEKTKVSEKKINWM